MIQDICDTDYNDPQLVKLVYGNIEQIDHCYLHFRFVSVQQTVTRERAFQKHQDRSNNVMCT